MNTFTFEKNDRGSGNVFIDNGSIIWKYKGKITATIPIEKIRMIGEYTTDDGPIFDDWYLVFVINKDEWIQISWYANGSDHICKELEKMLQAKIGTGLANSIDWKSRIIWPNKMEGTVLLELHDDELRLSKEALEALE